jgi:hypothetical protein
MRENDKTTETKWMISGFRREVGEKRALLGYFSASSGNFLPMFWDNISVPSSGVFCLLKPDDWTDWLNRNVGEKLPLLAA